MPLIPFAHSLKYNKLVDVTEVPKGLKCECICPSCRMKFKARKGVIREHHFAHFKNADDICCYSYWVSVRDMAKQILRETTFIHIEKNKLFAKNNLVYSQSYSNVIINSTIEPQSCDFILDTSIGLITLYLTTPEHTRLHEIDNSVSFANKLYLEIDLKNFNQNNIISKKESLRIFLLENIHNKEFLLPSINLPIIDDSENEEKEHNNIPIVEKKQKKYISNQDRGHVDTIIKALYLDKRNLSTYTLDIIANMKRFYDYCTQHLVENKQYSYSVIYIEEGLRFIAYRNYYFTYAKINNYHILYSYKEGNFFNFTNSINYESVYTAMDKYIFDFQKDITLDKNDYVANGKILRILGIQEEYLNLEDVVTINSMIEFSNKEYITNNTDMLSSKLSTVKESRNLTLISYKNEFYCVAKLLKQLYIPSY